MIDWMLDGAVGWLQGIVNNILNAAWTLLTATLLHIPDVTGLPQVQTMTSRSLLVVNTAYVLMIMTAGVVIMTADSVQARYGARELLPRLVFGIAAANLATWICQTIIQGGNALVLGLTGQGIATDGSLNQLLRVLTAQMANPLIALLSLVIELMIAIMVLLLIAGWVSRFAALLVLAGIAPLAMACHGTPWTDPLAQLWWKAMLGLAGTVVLQAVALNTSLSIYLDPNSNLAAIGFPMDPTGILNLIVIACLMWFTVRLPGMVRRYVTSSSGRANIMGAIVRLVIVQQLTRGLGRALHTRTGAGTGRRGGGGGPGRGPGGGTHGGRGPRPHGPAGPGPHPGRQSPGRRPAPRRPARPHAPSHPHPGPGRPGPGGAPVTRTGAPAPAPSARPPSGGRVTAGSPSSPRPASSPAMPGSPSRPPPVTSPSTTTGTGRTPPVPGPQPTRRTPPTRRSPTSRRTP